MLNIVCGKSGSGKTALIYECIKKDIENGIKVYDRLLKKCVEYVNKGWDMRYRREDVVGIEIDTTFIFVHFNKEDYTKDAYPISIEIIFK